MKLLIVDPNRADQEATLRLLPSETYQVTVAQDAATALRVLDEGAVDIVLVEATMPTVSGNELVKRIRARESCTHAYVIMSSAKLVPGDIKTAFLVGADDFMRKPFGRDELLCRLEGLSRIRRWASRVLTSGAFDGVANSRADLTAISAWTSLDTSVCSELSDMLGFPLSPVPANDALDGSVEVATLPLSLASENAEVCLAVGIDGMSSTALAETMFGDPGVDAAAIKDMMREIANVAAGAFKRIAASEGRTFTTGLPSEATAKAFRKANAKARRQWVGAVEGSPIQLRFEVELRVRELKQFRVADLKEGMVLAHNVQNQAGALLMASGTRLTEVTLKGLNRALGDQALIEVVEASN